MLYSTIFGIDSHARTTTICRVVGPQDRGPRGIVFSVGSLTCGKTFIARSAQAMLERFWAESKDPESRFCDEEPVPPCVRIPTEDAAVFRARIDEMKAIYADEGRSDWFDAD